jgi:hypothetical protein
MLVFPIFFSKLVPFAVVIMGTASGGQGHTSGGFQPGRLVYPSKEVFATGGNS